MVGLSVLGKGWADTKAHQCCKASDCYLATCWWFRFNRLLNA